MEHVGDPPVETPVMIHEHVQKWDRKLETLLADIGR